MAHVGFDEIYRYGTNFFAYVLFVWGVAVALVAGGAYLASRTMSLTDPSVAGLSEPTALAGLAVGAVGLVVGTIGSVGLWHKLLAESVDRALAAREAAALTGTATGAAEGESGDPTAAEQPEEAADDATPGTGESADGEPTGTRSPTVDAGDEVARESGSDAASAATEGRGGDSLDRWTPPDPDELEAEMGEDAEAAESGTAAAETAESEDTDDTADDETLADEGVDSFSPASEGDPLDDRMPSEEE